MILTCLPSEVSRAWILFPGSSFFSGLGVTWISSSIGPQAELDNAKSDIAESNIKNFFILSICFSPRILFLLPSFRKSNGIFMKKLNSFRFFSGNFLGLRDVLFFTNRG